MMEVIMMNENLLPSFYKNTLESIKKNLKIREKND